MFEDLFNRLTKIEENIALLLDLHMQQTNSLTTYKDVARLLGLTTRTIYTYIKDAKLIQDKHYYINAKGKIVFIPKGIMEFKLNPSVIQNNTKGDSIASRVMHPVASRVLQGVA